MQDIVWERLTDVGGNNDFVGSTFKPFKAHTFGQNFGTDSPITRGSHYRHEPRTSVPHDIRLLLISRAGDTFQFLPQVASSLCTLISDNTRGKSSALTSVLSRVW